jgi:hypothetical protein
MNIKEINTVMAELSREMEKMGIVSEMVQDAMEDMNDDVNIDNDSEVDKIIFEMEK